MTRCLIVSYKEGRSRYKRIKGRSVRDQALRVAFRYEPEDRGVTLEGQQGLCTNSRNN